MDLMSLLPLLSGNADTAQILQTVLGQGRCEKPREPTPPPCTPSPPCNYAKLYPDYQRVADLPRCDEPPKKPPRPQPDLTQLLSLFTALQQRRNEPAHNAACAPPEQLTPIAPCDIRDSLRALLDLNALGCTD